MESAKPGFTKTENKIYDFIQQKPETAALCTIIQTARLCGCSKSAVLRFCQKIGYTGYSEFCYDFMQYSRDNQILPEDGTAGLMASCMASYQNALSEMQNMDAGQIINLVKKIKNVQVVRTLGLGESGFCARQFASNLNLLGKPAISITDMIEYFRTADTVDPEGLYIFFSVNGICKAYQELPKAIRAYKAPLILITNSARAPLGKYADETIQLPAAFHKGGIQLDMHGLMFIFISILTEYYKQNVSFIAG